MRHDIEVATTVLGMNATRQVSGTRWEFTLLVCTQCGLSRTFTTNASQIAQYVPGASIATVPGR
jgi:hypothetical protein